LRGRCSGTAGGCFALTAVITAGSVVRLSIPIHDNKPLKTGLLKHLAKLAEIADKELSRLRLARAGRVRSAKTSA